MSDTQDWNSRIIDEFRANGGRVGGQFESAPLLLLHTTGARTGQDRVHPMMYLDLDAKRYVFATKAGADTDPDWYRNLVAHPDVEVEVGTERYRADAAALAEPERSQVYDVQARRYPGFAEYEENTERIIPVVELTRRP